MIQPKKIVQSEEIWTWIRPRWQSTTNLCLENSTSMSWVLVFVRKSDVITVKLRHFNRYVGFFTKCGEILSINEISTYLTRSQPNTTRSIKFPLKIIAPPWLTISQPNPMDLTARIIKLLWRSKTHIPMVGEEWHDSRPELIFHDFLTMLPLKYSLEHLL